MSNGAPPSDDVRLILERYRRLAVVGLSPRPERPSYRAMVHMAANGYEITPVNPACEQVLGNPCVASLEEAAAQGPLEIVDIFRRPEDIPPIVDEAIELGAKVVWMQLGLRPRRPRPAPATPASRSSRTAASRWSTAASSAASTWSACPPASSARAGWSRLPRA